LKFFRLILHRSAIAEFVELIKLVAFSFETNFSAILCENEGRRRLRFAENNTSASQTANVGIVTSMTAMPTTLPPR
jgi:hypothetical protein